MQVSETLMPNMILTAAMLFYLFRNRLANVSIVKYFSGHISRLAQLGFGAYLIHALLISIVWDIGGFDPLLNSPGLWIPILTVLISTVSLACAALLQKIPALGNYIA